MAKLSVLKLIVAVLLQSAGAAVGAQAPNRDQGLTALEKEAEAGDVRAQVQLGLAYASGDGVAVDETQSVKWFQKAADRQDPAGEYYLGELYATGRGVSVDYAAALKWLRKAADQGEAHAQYNLAAMYAQGLGVSKDEAEAAKWMRRAADEGLAAGQFGLGSMYAHGGGVRQSETDAAAWYRKAAEQGDTPAMNNLAVMLATSRNPEIRNPKEAVTVSERAVAVESNNASYLDTLAMAYFEAGQARKAADTERRGLFVFRRDEGTRARRCFDDGSALPAGGIPAPLAHVMTRRYQEIISLAYSIASAIRYTSKRRHVRLPVRAPGHSITVPLHTPLTMERFMASWPRLRR